MSYDDIEKFITQGTLLLGTQDDRQKMADYVCSCMEGYIERQELYGKYDYGVGKWIGNIRKMMFREKEDISRLQNFALHHPGLRDDLSGDVLSEFESSVRSTSSDSPDCPFYAEGEIIKEARDKAESNIEGFFEALKMLDKLRRSFQKRFYGKMDAYAGIEGKIGPMIETGCFGVYRLGNWMITVFV